LSQHRAFSVLELVLILAIIATVAAIAAPRYVNSLSNYRCEAAAQRIIRDLGVARAEARSRSTNITVTFDVANNKYGISGVTSLESASAPASLILSDPPYHAQLLSADFGGDEVVTFDGYGLPDDTGTVVVGVGGVTRIVDLPDTGLADLEDPP
jgi:type II secretory pathway pseudopilin PulG